MKAAATFFLAACLVGLSAKAGSLATYTVGSQIEAAPFTATGVVEAVRHGTLGAQVAGRIVRVLVRNGDHVAAGQSLIQIEVGDSEDVSAASAAAASGAAARLVSARAEFERAQRLRSQDFISAAAMQRAEASLRSAEADAQASGAQSRAARTRASWHSVSAPYAGQVAELSVSAGDLATPGRALLSLYDPAALRVLAEVPESLATQLRPDKAARLVAGHGEPTLISSWRVIPSVDAATHSVEIQADLPVGSRLEPGQFATLLLPLQASASNLRIPLSAVLHRSEVTGVYVVDSRGAAHLRQVRLGPVVGDAVAVLAGLQSGEQVALNPTAAGRQ